MLEIFQTAFVGSLIAIIKVFLVIGVAGLLVRRRVILPEHIRGLTVATVNVFLPCLIYSKITGKFDPSALPFWWMLPLASMAMIGSGVGLGYLFFWRERTTKKDFIALSSFHNAGYLVLPLGKILFPDQWDEFALYCFLFILGVSPLLWSVGKVLISSGDAAEKGNWRQMITPPLIANLLALFMVFTELRGAVPGIVTESITILAQACVPVALFVLGATVGAISLRTWPDRGDIARVLVVKFLCIPLLVLGAVHLLGLSASIPLLAAMLLLHSSSPPAAGLVLQVKKYGGDESRVGCMMVITYLTAMLTLPFWQAVGRCLQ
ncbi:MAG: AEC family transporter [Planctomycetota bacterium]|jgi:predicted permease